MNKITCLILFFALYTEGVVCQTPKPNFQGQAPLTEKVDTRNHAIVPQWRGKFQFNTITFDNDFEGARLNGITQDDDTLFTAIITAENYPINPSPWYAFKVSSEIPRTFWVRLTYLNAKHRYFPKISRDGKTWQTVDSSDCILEKDTTKTVRTFQENALSESAYVRIRVDKNPTWIAAQELITSKEMAQWLFRYRHTAFQQKIAKPMYLLPRADAICLSLSSSLNPRYLLRYAGSASDDFEAICQ